MNVEAMKLEQDMLDNLENMGIHTDHKTIDEVQNELEDQKEMNLPEKDEEVQ